MRTTIVIMLIVFKLTIFFAQSNTFNEVTRKTRKQIKIALTLSGEKLKISRPYADFKRIQCLTEGYGNCNDLFVYILYKNSICSLDEGQIFLFYTKSGRLYKIEDYYSKKVNSLYNYLPKPELEVQYF